MKRAFMFVVMSLAIGKVAILGVESSSSHTTEIPATMLTPELTPSQIAGMEDRAKDDAAANAAKAEDEARQAEEAKQAT